MTLVIFFLPGAFLLGSALAWRLRGERVTGTLIGVRASGKTSYCSVYRYSDATGRTHDAACNDMSVSLAGKQTGLTQQLMVLADRPLLVRKTNSILLEAGGTALLVVGFLTAWPQGSAVLGFDLALGALMAWHAFKRKIGAGVRSGASAPAPEAASLQRAEDILATSEAAQRAVRNQRRTGPISIVSGLAMLAVALYAGRSLAVLEVAGVRAHGKVLELVLRSAGSRGGTAYHPVVRFTTASGTSVQFEDGVGASPSPYHVGDEVQVLYLANASPTNAIIDEGLGNWTMAVVFTFIGAALIALGIWQKSSARSMDFPTQSMSIPVPARASFTRDAGESPVPINVAASKLPAIVGVTIVPPDSRRSRRYAWLALYLIVGWSLWMASAMIPSPNSATGLRAALLMFAPALGAFLLFSGQSLAVVVIIARALTRGMSSAEAAASGAAAPGDAGPLARVLDRVLTFVLVMMAAGCVLIAIGLGAQVVHYFSNFRT